MMARTEVAAICFILGTFAIAAWARPLEYDSLSGGKLSQKLLAALSKHQAPAPKASLQPAFSAKDLLDLQKFYESNIPAEESEPLAMIPEDSDNAQYSPLEQLMSQIMADYEANENAKEYADQANNDALYYTDGQDAWFDGPVKPSVHFGQFVDSPSIPKNPDQLETFLLNLLSEQYKQKQIDADEDANVEKRRQKIVIKDDNYAEQLASTASPPVASTAAPRKAKLPVHKPAKAITHRGQKEVALLRPAEIKPKEWPAELEDNNLSEEEASLKELPMRGQSRPVRDVLTSQLDGLKAEAQTKGALPKEKSAEKQN